jgi:N utilization substance protein B
MSAPPPPRAGGQAPPRQARSVARLAAVQALYQMETGGAGVETVVREFRDHRFAADLEGETMAAADEPFFGDLARGVVAAQGDIDRAIVARLASGWRLERIDATVRAILRCAVFELLRRPEIPREVVINEYLEITKSFFSGPEPGFVNGLLDSIGRDDRAAG